MKFSTLGLQAALCACFLVASCRAAALENFKEELLRSLLQRALNSGKQLESEVDLDGMCGQDLECKQAILAHNFFRAGHKDTPPMTWDSSIATTAQSWADEIIRTNDFRHSIPGYGFRCSNCGENFYFTSSTSSSNVIDACKAWYGQEIRSNYNYITGTADSYTTYFTQMVWDESIRLGCGVASGGFGTVVICQYNPEGNYVGADLTKRVHPPKDGVSTLDQWNKVADYVNEELQDD